MSYPFWEPVKWWRSFVPFTCGHNAVDWDGYPVEELFDGSGTLVQFWIGSCSRCFERIEVCQEAGDRPPRDMIFRMRNKGRTWKDYLAHNRHFKGKRWRKWPEDWEGYQPEESAA